VYVFLDGLLEKGWEKEEMGKEGRRMMGK